MFIEHLRVRNFRSVRELEVDFTHLGLCLVVGPNGAGKSTILEALLWGLYGIHREGQSNHERLVPRWSPDRGPQVTVALRLGDHRLVVHREVDPQGRRMRLFLQMDGESRTLRSLRETQEMLERLLRMSADTFRTLVLWEQGSPGLLEHKPAHRLQVLGELLGIENWREIYRQRLQGARRELMGRIRTLRQMLEQHRETMFRVPTWERELERLRQEAERLRHSLEEARKGLQEAQREEARVRTLREEIRELEKQRAQLQEVLKSVLPAARDGKYLKALQRMRLELARRHDALATGALDAAEVQDRLRALQEAYVAWQNAFQRLQEVEHRVRILQAHRARVREAEERLRKDLGGEGSIADRVRNRIAAWMRRVREALPAGVTLPDLHLDGTRDPWDIMADFQAWMEDVREAIGAAEGRIRNIQTEQQKRLELLEQGKGTCPTCGTPLEPARQEHLLQDIRTSLEDHTAHLELLERARGVLGEVSREADSLYSQVREWQWLLREARKVEDQYGEDEKAHQEIQKELEHWRETHQQAWENLVGDEGFWRHLACQALRTALNDLAPEQLVPEVVESAHRLEQVEAHLSRLRASLPDRDPGEAVKAHKTRVQEIEQALRQVTRDIGILEGRLAAARDAQAQFERWEAELAEAEARVQRIRALEHVVGVRVPLYLLGTLLPILEDLMAEFLRELAPTMAHRFRVVFRTTMNRGRGVHEALHVLVQDQQGQREREYASLSGGERVVVGLALRLSLHLLLVNLWSTHLPRILFIDETFGPLDEEVQQQVALALSRLRETFGLESLVVVTHSPHMLPYADSLMHVQRAGDGTTEVSLEKRREVR